MKNVFQNTLYAASKLIESQANEFGWSADEFKIEEIYEGEELEEFWKGKFIF